MDPTVNPHSYSKLLSERDLYRQDCSRLEAELRKVRHELTLERYRRLSLVMAQAYTRQDRAAFEAAAKERAGLGVSFVEAAEMEAA
jgi:hypothetical protein